MQKNCSDNQARTRITQFFFRGCCDDGNFPDGAVDSAQTPSRKINATIFAVESAQGVFLQRWGEAIMGRAENMRVNPYSPGAIIRLLKFARKNQSGIQVEHQCFRANSGCYPLTGGRISPDIRAQLLSDHRCIYPPPRMTVNRPTRRSRCLADSTSCDAPDS